MFTLFFIDLGRKVLSFLYFFGGLTNLAVQTVYLTFKPPYKYERIVEQAKKCKKTYNLDINRKSANFSA